MSNVPDQVEGRRLRATALTQAVAYHSGVLQGADVERVLEVAEAFYDWIRGGSQACQEAQDGASAPGVADSSAGGAGRPVAKVADAPSGGVAGGGGVAEAKEELFPEGPVWPMVEMEERTKPVTEEDWRRIGEIRTERGIEKYVLLRWLRSRWGMKYGERMRRGDMVGVVDWLKAQRGGSGR